MIAIATTAVFAFAFALAAMVIVMTVRPEYDRIVRLLRHGPMAESVERVAIRTPKGRRASAMPLVRPVSVQSFRAAA